MRLPYRVLSLLLVFFAATASTTLAAVDPPVLVSPADGIVNQPLALTYSWQPSPGATRYKLEVSTDSLFTTMFFEDSTLTSTSRLIFHNVGVRYFWRVTAYDDTSSAVSPMWRHQTRTSLFVNARLQSPTDGATGLYSTILFRWEDLSPTTPLYRVQVDDDPGFGSPEVDVDSLTQPSYIADLMPATTYYWRVETTKNGGAQRGFSDTWSFTTAAALPPGVTLISPADGLTDSEIEITYQWAPVDSALFYTLQVTTDPSFADPVFVADSLTITEQYYDHIYSQRYYWRVLAQTPSTVLTSPVRTFMTRPIFPVSEPLLVAPSDGAVNQPTTLPLTWRSATNALSYRLLVAEDPNFTTLVAEQDGLTDTTAVVTDLAISTTYYWKVEGLRYEQRVASQTRSFTTTTNITLAPPTPTSPADSAIALPAQVAYAWNPVQGAQSYRLQVSTQQDFSSLFADVGDLSVTSLTVDGHALNTTYYWRVFAEAGTDSVASVVSQFTTLVDILAPPVLVAPADDAVDVTPSVTFSWNPVAGATIYRLQIATDAGLTTLVQDLDSLTTTSLQLGLAPTTTYFWRVIARNPIAVAASGVNVFTTAVAVPIENDASTLPDKFALQPNYPNPFNPSTTIAFDVPHSGPVTIHVFDALGREVARLVDGDRAAGRYTVTWSAGALPNGLYFARMEAGSFSQVRSMILMK